MKRRWKIENKGKDEDLGFSELMVILFTKIWNSSLYLIPISEDS